MYLSIFQSIEQGQKPTLISILLLHTLLETFLDGNTLVVSSIYLDARQLVAAATDLMTV